MNNYKVEKQDNEFVVVPEGIMHDVSRGSVPEGNLTKREQFAAAALTGLLASSKTTMMTRYEDITEQAVTIADKLIQELGRKVL